MSHPASIKYTSLTESILENVASLVIVCDHTGSIVYCSQSILNLLQVELSEVLGMGWWKLTRTDAAARNKEINYLKKIISGENPLDKKPYTNTIQDKEGNTYWIQWQDSFGPDNTIIGVGQNITEHHHAQKIIQEQRVLLESKNKDITDSINYARRIQRALLPHRREIWAAFPQSFVLYKPKDIVSGDFYFFLQNEKSKFIAVADCTGHGVPGAFMSMIGASKLTDAVSESSDPSVILSRLNTGIKAALKQSEGEESSRDGMDIALCAVDTENRIVHYAGANRPIWIIRKGAKEVEEIKATKKAIGGFTEDKQHFETHKIKLREGDTFYLSTDGYADTFGQGGKKIMTKKFKDILLSIQPLEMKEQKKFLDGFVEDWMGDTDQLDDILVIGIRV